MKVTSSIVLALPVFAGLSSALVASEIPTQAEADVVVVGGTVRAVVAAVEARKSGAEVCLVAPRPYLGDDLAGRLLLERGAIALPEDLARILACIDAHITEPLQVRDLARALYISESTIQRRFLAYLGMKPAAYIRSKKLATAAGLLRGGATVLEAGLAVGYADNSHFIRIFRRQYGVTPHTYARR
jgi:AraC-like DNA-binding protein